MERWNGGGRRRGRNEELNKDKLDGHAGWPAILLRRLDFSN